MRYRLLSTEGCKGQSNEHSVEANEKVIGYYTFSTVKCMIRYTFQTVVRNFLSKKLMRLRKRYNNYNIMIYGVFMVYLLRFEEIKSVSGITKRLCPLQSLIRAFPIEMPGFFYTALFYKTAQITTFVKQGDRSLAVASFYKKIFVIIILG